MYYRNLAGSPIILLFILMLICGNTYAQQDDIPDNSDETDDTTPEESELEKKTLILETEEREMTLSSWEEKIKDIKEDI
ncbi:MAG: hypothetical protein K8S87_11605, partial [Planctomycetes bacterium]|nr:hypothetical protein [Planctomycetota bacterium]